eukprot:354339-Chlamydomonas_euryale.AAC.5
MASVWRSLAAGEHGTPGSCDAAPLAPADVGGGTPGVAPRTHSVLSRMSANRRSAARSVAGGVAASTGSTTIVHMTPVLDEEPYMTLAGHTEDVLDLSWSRGHLLLSASVDTTVKLWHVNPLQQGQAVPPVASFQHPDFVTSVRFHPGQTGVFASGCFDGRLRLWDAAEECVLASSPVQQDSVTTVAFSHDAQRIIVGTLKGMCRFYRHSLAPRPAAAALRQRSASTVGGPGGAAAIAPPQHSHISLGFPRAVAGGAAAGAAGVAGATVGHRLEMIGNVDIKVPPAACGRGRGKGK